MMRDKEDYLVKKITDIRKAISEEEEAFKNAQPGKTANMRLLDNLSLTLKEAKLQLLGLQETRRKLVRRMGEIESGLRPPGRYDPETEKDLDRELEEIYAKLQIKTEPMRIMLTYDESSSLLDALDLLFPLRAPKAAKIAYDIGVRLHIERERVRSGKRLTDKGFEDYRETEGKDAPEADTLANQEAMRK